MELVISLGILLTALGALGLGALAARTALPGYLSFDEIPADLVPRIEFIDRYRTLIVAAGALGVVVGPVLMASAR